MGRLSKAEKLKHCAGCYNDFYNGRNNLGGNNCWGLSAAKLILRKRVHVDHVPPWNQKAQKFLSCYRQSRYVFVGPNQTC
jgi:hypothetical protein